MLVNFKRSFFAPGGTLLKKGTREYNGDPKDLPRDATVVSEKGRLPVGRPGPKAGFGAKPMEEQVLDLIPGAAPTHVLEQTGPDAPRLSDAEREEEAKNADKAREAEAKASAKADDKADAETKKEVEAGVKNAEKAAEKVEEVTDPLAVAKKK